MTDPLAPLKQAVHAANLALHRSGLVLYTFGNVSGIHRERRVLVIKPSGVAYEDLTPEDMVPVSLDTGEVLGGRLRPSSDTPTHLVLYRAFERAGGIAHTHSEYATTFAQARAAIRCMGTTHADSFRGDVPPTRPLTAEEIASDYEANTGHAIVETFRSLGLDPAEVPAVLVSSHGPFAWGADAAQAVENAVVLEHLARMEFELRVLAPDAPRPSQALVDKHFARKHGKAAYYGQER